MVLRTEPKPNRGLLRYAHELDIGRSSHQEDETWLRQALHVATKRLSSRASRAWICVATMCWRWLVKSVMAFRRVPCPLPDLFACLLRHRLAVDQDSAGCDGPTVRRGKRRGHSEAIGHRFDSDQHRRWLTCHVGDDAVVGNALRIPTLVGDLSHDQRTGSS